MSASLSHVCLPALAACCALLSVHFTVAIAIARLSSLADSRAGDRAVLATKSRLAPARSIACLFVNGTEALS